MTRRFVGQADPIDRLPVLIVTMIDLSRYHSRTLLEQQVGYPAGPMAKLPDETVPMNQEKMMLSPTVAVLQNLLHLVRSTRQAVVELSFVHSTLQAVVEQDFVHPKEQVVEEQVFGYSRQAVVEQDFVFPILPTVAEQAFDPIQVLVVAKLGFDCPILLAVAERPMNWAVEPVGSMDLRLE